MTRFRQKTPSASLPFVLFFFLILSFSYFILFLFKKNSIIGIDWSTFPFLPNQGSGPIAIAMIKT